MFYLYEGNTGNLPTDRNHLNFRWSGANILFSMTRKGNAASIHFTVRDKKSERKLKQAVNEFCVEIFRVCKWCDMIIGQVKKNSIVRIGLKCGFKLIGQKDGVSIMIRKR